MNVALAFVRSFTIRRIFLATVLTTVACAIIKPYFLMEVTFYALWLRLFIVAIVMLIAYVVTESVYPLVPAPRLKLMHAQFIAMTLGSVLGTIASGLAIGRSLEQMMTTEPILWGMIFFTGTGIAFGVLTVTVLRLREQAARNRLDLERASVRPDITLGVTTGRDGTGVEQVAAFQRASVLKLYAAAPKTTIATVR